MHHLTEFQMAAVQAALAKLFSVKSCFDICHVRDIAEVLGQKLQGPDFEALRLFHCIDYKDMSPKVRLQIRQTTLQVLGLDPTQPEFVTEVEEVKPSKATAFSSWLLGVKK